MQKQANPMIWGAVGAIGVVTAVTVARVTGYAPDAMSGYSFASLVGAGMLWGALIAVAKNRLGR